MTLYELSIDAARLREAEAVVSLEGRGFPTLVTQWESRLFDQVWTTTIVLDYVIPLPPLMMGQATFNEVRIAAYTAGAPTKFLYFGTEMNSSVPRVAPEMENKIASPREYAEFRLEEVTCPLPYLKLIQATPRIYGNGPQDYYSPPIKVERYDGTASQDHLADFFPTVVANLDNVKGSLLTDPNRGLWNGARFVGVTSIAILRQGKAVGLHRRQGKTDKDALPAEVKRRDPNLDVLREWVALDVGAASMVVAVRPERGTAELIRIGASTPPGISADYENPSEVAFESLGRTLKAWRDRVILPMTRWDDVVVGHTAKALRSKPGPEQTSRTAATLTALPLLRERTERQEAFKLRGRTDPDANELLKKPAPPVIDEDGIGAHDPFDPIELYAYYVGLTVNHRSRGIHTRYAVAMPTGWTATRRESVLIALRRGFFRSLPAGLANYDDLERLEVVDAGPSAISFAVHAFRAFGVQPKGDSVPFGVIDAGASETGVIFGVYRDAKGDEKSAGNDRMIEYLEPSAIPWLAGERMLHRLAYAAYSASATAASDGNIPFELPPGEEGAAELEALLVSTPEARANTVILKDALRVVLEGDGTAKLPAKVKLASTDGSARELTLAVDRATLTTMLQGWIDEGVAAIVQLLKEALTKIGRDPDPYEGLHIFVGGRVGMHAYLNDRLASTLPKNVLIHRFKEPDKTNLSAPTVKTATALGVLSMRLDKVGAVLRSESRDAFRYRVGRARHGQLADVIQPSVEYDEWREMGACPKPDVEVLFMSAVDDGEVAADDPRVMRAVCSLGPEAVGQRVYVRAVGPSRVEVTVGPQGGEPSSDAPLWGVDLATSLADRVR